MSTNRVKTPKQDNIMVERVVKTRIILEVAQSEIGEAILVQRMPQPLMRGYIEKGADYVCAGCREMVLLDNIAPGEVWDLLFRCYSCGTLNIGPRRPPGTPLPAELIVCLPGEHVVTNTLDNAKGTTIVGKKSHDQRAVETGELIPKGTRPCASAEALGFMQQAHLYLVNGACLPNAQNLNFGGNSC